MRGAGTDRHAVDRAVLALTVLTLRALGLGDLLTALPALRGIRRAFPAERHTIATSGWVAPLVDRLAVADDVVAVGELEPIPFDEPVDVAVNLHGRGPQSTALLRALRPAELVAWDDGRSRWDPAEHEVDRWCRLLTEHGIDADPADIDIRIDAEPTHVVVLHPGGKDPARRWPTKRWCALARRLATRGLDVAITGSADERALAAEIAAGAGLAAGSVLAGEGDVLAFATTVAGAAAVVSGDTGAGHLATALRRPSVLLFGANSPAQWGPPRGRPIHRVLWKGAGGLNRITVDECWDELALLLGDRLG